MTDTEIALAAGPGGLAARCGDEFDGSNLPGLMAALNVSGQQRFESGPAGNEPATNFRKSISIGPCQFRGGKEFPQRCLAVRRDFERDAYHEDLAGRTGEDLWRPVGPQKRAARCVGCRGERHKVLDGSQTIMVRGGIYSV